MTILQIETQLCVQFILKKLTILKTDASEKQTSWSEPETKNVHPPSSKFESKGGA